MFISIDDKAASWFTREFEVKKPISIRMFPQYAGLGEQNKGYCLAFSAEAPSNIGYSIEVSGINFFVEDGDVWFFEDTETNLSVDEILQELTITYNEKVQSTH